jgi:hypothetical protein
LHFAISGQILADVFLRFVISQGGQR